MKSRPFSPFAFLLAGICSLAGAGAADFTWNPNGVNGKWNNPDNWLTPPPWPLVTDSRYTTLTFGASAYQDLTLDITGQFLLNRLTFGSAAPALTLSTDRNAGLQFRGAELGLQANLVTDTDADVTLTLPVSVASDLRLSGSGTGNLTISGGFTSLEAYTLTKDSAGTLTFAGATNNWKGSLRANAGVIQVTDGSTLYTNSADNTAYQAYIGSGAGSNGTVSVGGGTGASLWNNFNAAIVAGYTGTGTLNVTGGGRVAGGSGSIGEYGDAVGTVNVGGGTGAATWWNYQNLYVGNRGEGTLNVTGGGTVENQVGIVGQVAGSTGNVSVGGGTGTSLWQNNLILVVGQNGDGSLKITGGGTVTNTIGYIAYDPTGTGAVEVGGGTGASAWTSSHEVYVGSYGKGNLTITGGGTVSNTTGYIADKADGTGLVKIGGGTGSATWTNSGNLFVGVLGDGEMRITGGGTVTNATGIIADSAGSTSSVSVGGGTGQSAWTNSGSAFYVGNGGNGTLKITGGGTVTSVVNNASSGVYVGYAGTGVGRVEVGGGDGDGASQWKNYGSTFIGVDGTGSLAITGGGTVTSGTGVIGDGATGRGTADIGGGTGASTWTNSGSLTVGNAGGGEMTITGGGSVSSTGVSWIGRMADGTGTVRVGGGTGASSWTTNGGQLMLGHAGTGTLSVTGGGSVTTGEIRSGVLAGSYGTIEVGGGTGASSLALTDLYLGYLEGSSMTITGGGTVSTNFAHVGYYNLATGVRSAGSSVTVGGGTGAAKWDVRSELIFGGTLGTLDIIGGGDVTSGGGYIGLGVGETGVVTVGGGSGESSWIDSRWIVVGLNGGGTGTLNINTGGLVQAPALDGGNASSSVNFDGGTLRITATDGASHRFVLGAGGGTIDTAMAAGGNFTLDGNISGSGRLTKTGTGTFVLAGSASSYSGGTLVSQGRLWVETAGAAGTGGVRVEAGAILDVKAAVFSNAVTLSGGTYSRDFGVSTNLAGKFTATSNFAGGAGDTTATILAGTTSSSIATSLQARFDGIAPAGNDQMRRSDVYYLSGNAVMGGTAAPMTLQLSIAANDPGLFLAFLDADNLWKPASGVNTGNSSFAAGFGYQGSFQEFQDEYGTGLGDKVGAWGSYVENGTTHTWAIIDQGGTFAIVPEPSGVVLAGLGAVTLAFRRRRP